MLFPAHILIVEDEVITQRYLKDILAHYQVEKTTSVDDAEGALDALRKEVYDMVLMDINIKGSVDGIQLAQKILDRYTLPIVFISAHSDQETFQEALELSPYGFIAKPFSGKDVEMTLQVAYKRYLAHKKSVSAKELEKSTDTVVISKHYRYSKTSKTLYCDDEAVKLSNKHKMLLDVLCRNLNITVDYMTLVTAIWGNEEVSGSALRTLVYSLRKQLPDLPLVSYSKVGYALKTK